MARIEKQRGCDRFSCTKNKNLKTLIFLFVSVFLLGTVLSAQSQRKVYTFDIKGLRLKANLDKVISQYNINHIRVNKDVFGIINGYEIKKRTKHSREWLALSFTGEKRLYRIHYSKLYEQYRYRSKALYQNLIQKYGPAWNDNLPGENEEIKNIRACWGMSCNTYPATEPVMTARIHHASGRLELMLSDNRIFKKDWKIYKSKLANQKSQRNGVTSNQQEGSRDF